MSKRLQFPAALIGLLLFAATVSAQDAKGKSAKAKTAKAKTAGTSDYFPAAAGNKWEYKTTEGKVTTTIIKEEEIGGVMCWRLEADTADGKKTTEYVHVAPDGVYRYQASGQNIVPPLLFLKLPPKPGATWEVDSKVLNKSLKGTFTLSEGEVTVPAGKYEDVLIVKSTNFKVDGQDLPHTYYFAKGVGIVKQVVTFAGQDIVLELEKFTPAK